MYELAKVSLNNRGNEIKSTERRTQESQGLNSSMAIESDAASTDDSTLH